MGLVLYHLRPVRYTDLIHLRRFAVRSLFTVVYPVASRLSYLLFFTVPSPLSNYLYPSAELTPLERMRTPRWTDYYDVRTPIRVAAGGVGTTY